MTTKFHACVILLVSGALLPAFSGCQSSRDKVVALTGTMIGVEISQNPANQSPQAKLGYNRIELAIVPSNRSAKDGETSTGEGAKDVPDVLMELKYSGIFSGKSGDGIYQRLAVGTTAVKQRGAAYMFAASLDEEAQKEVVKALESIPTATTEVRKLQGFYFDSLDDTGRASVDGHAVKLGFTNFSTMILANPSEEQTNKLIALIQGDMALKQKWSAL